MRSIPLLLVLILCSIQLSLQVYNETLALEFVKLSAMAYCDSEVLTKWSCGKYCNEFKGQIELLRHFNKVTPEGGLSYTAFLDTKNKFIVFAFRGTNTGYELINEIVTGYDVKYDLYDIPDAVVMDFFYIHYKNNVREDFLTHLKLYRQNYSSYTVVFTGHSLGGALTTHAAMDAVLGGYVPKNQTMLYNYGSPRVGNFAWAQAFVNNIPEINRITHNRDIVPHVPFCIREKGACVTGEGKPGYNKTGNIIWYAWHIWNEIWYNENFTQSVICTHGEDPQCQDRYIFEQTDIKDHHMYFVPVTCDGNKATEDFDGFEDSMEIEF